MFRLLPCYKDYIWGGVRLNAEYGKRAPFNSVAESWELSLHPDGLTRVGSGEYAGATLRDYLIAHPEAAPGVTVDEFPILVKLIDAKVPLSVQVHPDDAYARAHANSPGKTELWHILDAEPDAYLYLGLDRKVTGEELSERIAAGTVEDVLRKVSVRPGETYYIPAGTLHAIGGGVLLCEVQESSNLTYRVYDYGRRDAAGNLRPLHIGQALSVASLAPEVCTPPGAGEDRHGENGREIQTLVRCRYFVMRRLMLNTKNPFMLDERGFTHLLCTEGEAMARQGEMQLILHKGDGVFVSAGEAVELCGRATLLLIHPGVQTR